MPCRLAKEWTLVISTSLTKKKKKLMPPETISGEASVGLGAMARFFMKNPRIVGPHSRPFCDVQRLLNASILINNIAC